MEGESEEQFGFMKGKGTRDAIGLIRTIRERFIEKDKDVYAVFIDLEKAFVRVDWKKLIGILKKIGVDWKERRFLSNLYMKQRIKVKIGEEISEGREIGRGVWQGIPLLPTLFNVYLEDLMKNCFPKTGSVNIGGRKIKCIRFANDMALLAEDERMLKNMLMEQNDRCEVYEIKINISMTKTMVIGKKPKKIDIRVGDKSIEQVASFKYWGCNISSNMNCCQDLRQMRAMAKETLTGREAFSVDTWKKN